jgi:hypothetical protein
MGFDTGLSFAAVKLLSCILSDESTCRSLEETGKARPLIRSICDVAPRALINLKRTVERSPEELALTHIFMVIHQHAFSAGVMRDFMCSIMGMICTCFEDTYVGQEGRTRLAGNPNRSRALAWNSWQAASQAADTSHGLLREDRGAAQGQ